MFVSSILFGLGLLKWIQRNLETSTQSLLQKEISGDLFIKQIMIELVRDFVGNLKILNFQNARFLSLICFSLPQQSSIFRFSEHLDSES